MTEAEWLRLHSRALLLIDELHRIGFEQLRFSRSYEGQRVRLEIYAASSATMQDWMFQGHGPRVLLSDIIHYVDPKWLHLSKWDALLAGDLQPKHLAGHFVLDFPDLVRPAYGPDHAYREWFRTLRPYIQQNVLPVTWAEDPYGTEPDFSQHVQMYRPDGTFLLLPRPPANPFVH